MTRNVPGRLDWLTNVDIIMKTVILSLLAYIPGDKYLSGVIKKFFIFSFYRLMQNILLPDVLDHFLIHHICALPLV